MKRQAAAGRHGRMDQMQGLRCEVAGGVYETYVEDRRTPITQQMAHYRMPHKTLFLK